MTAGAPTTTARFRERALIAIEDVRLQGALEGATGRFRQGRDTALADLPGSEALRDRLKAARSATLANLDQHLAAFERNARTAGAQVYRAADGSEAAGIVIDIARQHGATLATKTKSMATEEIHLNQALKAAGITPVETDLGEWIIQLSDEPPFHIIAPAIHKTRGQVADLFSHESGQALPPDDILRLTAEARRMLREQFLAARLGITGANIGVAESGSIVLVTNEGNAEMVTSLPPVHVVVMGIEKIAPTWDDAAAWLALLARSATGQPLSVYTTVISGPARLEDPDGPAEVHIILLDNGRSAIAGTIYEEVLQCIRCGACLNICPVYREAGGHAYGSPYSGPIGAVISPLLYGLEQYEALPQASSLCGACLDVCPVRIDLPRMLLELRADEVRANLAPRSVSLAERAAAYVLARPRLMGWMTAVLRLLQKPLARQGHLRLPGRLNPAGRRLPALAPKSFHQMWEDGDWGLGIGDWGVSAAVRFTNSGQGLGTLPNDRFADNDLGSEIAFNTGSPIPDPRSQIAERSPGDIPSSLSEQFVAALIAAKGEVRRADSLEGALERVGEVLREIDARSAVVDTGPPPSGAASPLAAVDPAGRWPQVEWRAVSREPMTAAAQADQHAGLREFAATADIGLSVAEAALAETGTVVVSSGPGRSRLTGLLPPVHLVLVSMSCLTADIFTWTSAQKERQGWPFSSAMTLITGPSKTADIEQTMAIGVHGPGRLITVLYEE